MLRVHQTRAAPHSAQIPDNRFPHRSHGCSSPCLRPDPVAPTSPTSAFYHHSHHPPSLATASTPARLPVAGRCQRLAGLLAHRVERHQPRDTSPRSRRGSNDHCRRPQRSLGVGCRRGTHLLRLPRRYTRSIRISIRTRYPLQPRQVRPRCRSHPRPGLSIHRSSRTARCSIHVTP